MQMAQVTQEKVMGRTFAPQIFLYNVNNWKKKNQIDFKIKNVNNHKSKLYLSDVAVHEEMMNILREKKINSYSLTPKEHKQISLVLRGLYFKSEPEDIKVALNKVAPETVSKVIKFKTPHSKKNNLDTGLFLIMLAPGKKLGDVANIKYILNQTVVWEKPKKKGGEIQ